MPPAQRALCRLWYFAGSECGVRVLFSIRQELSYPGYH